MKKPKRYFLTNIWTLPPALISWTVVLFVRVFWGHKLEWLDGLWCELKPDSWPARTWYKKWGGTTLVRGGFYAPNRKGEPGKIDTRTEAHEHIHIEQSESNSLYGFLLFIYLSVFTSVGLLTSLIIWTAAPVLIYLCAGIQAVVRGESFYKGNHYEEHAYCKDDFDLEKFLDECDK